MAENKYTVTFVPPPHRTPGFWSITMYDYNTQYPIENPINRYSLGSDDDLIMNKDGTVTLYIQNTNPGKDKEANWLPSPKSGRGSGNDRGVVRSKGLESGAVRAGEVSWGETRWSNGPRMPSPWPLWFPTKRASNSLRTFR
jgi:hypothetical protein